MVVASATLDELKSGLRTRGVKVTKSSPQAKPSSEKQTVFTTPSDREEGAIVPVSFHGPDWAATSVTVVVDP
jgi:hypothetical protein